MNDDDEASLLPALGFAEIRLQDGCIAQSSHLSRCPHVCSLPHRNTATYNYYDTVSINWSE